MFRIFLEERLIALCIFTCLGLSILLRIFLGVLYRRMIKEADNMASTRNRLLRQCKTKFASCYELSGGVPNIPIFVDRFLNRMALGRISFDMMYHLSGQLMLLAVVCSGIGACRSILAGRTLGDVLPFYIVSLFGLYAYFSISTVVDVNGKRRILKVNLVDYLENHLSPRIDITRQDLEMLYGDASFEERRIQSGRQRRHRSVRGAVPKPQRLRTVELIPVGSRLAAGGETMPANAGMTAQTSMTAKAGISATQTIAVPNSAGQASCNQTVHGQASLPAQEDTALQKGGALQEGNPLQEDSSAAVTEEELEALLKEFLTS